MTMKTCNYLTKLPQEATIKKVETFRYYDLITLDLPVPKQRLCPHCGSSDCIIKDSGAWQTVRHIPYGHRGSAITFHKRRLFCKDCCTSFYETPYWVHPSLHITQALYDSILLDLLEPISFTEAARRSCVSPDTVQSVFESIRFGLPKKLPETICIDEFKGNSGSSPFSGVSSLFTGVSDIFTSLFRRASLFPGVSPKLLIILVSTRFFWSSSLFSGVLYSCHQIFLKLHQLSLKLPITFLPC